MRLDKELQFEKKAEKLEYQERIEQLNEKIREENKHQHKILVKENRKWIYFLDALMILAILSNFGAITITNALVTYAEPDIVIYEANPIAASAHGFETNPQVQFQFYSIIIKLFAYLYLIIFYLYMRNTVKTEYALMILSIFAISIAFVLSYDFLNNFGLWIGGKI